MKTSPAETIENLDNFKADAIENAGEGETFMDPTSGPNIPKKRGRKKGGKNRPKEEIEAERMPDAGPPAVNIEELKKACRPVVEIISHTGEKLAESPEGALKPHEAEVILDSLALCVNQYLPSVLGAHPHLVILTLYLGQYSFRIYNLRQAKLAELIAEREAMQKAAQVQ